MNFNDICLEIPPNQIINLAKNETVHSNDTITFIDSWVHPLIYRVGESILCGPLIKVVEEFSKRQGYKYVKKILYLLDLKQISTS